MENNYFIPVYLYNSVQKSPTQLKPLLEIIYLEKPGNYY